MAVASPPSSEQAASRVRAEVAARLAGVLDVPPNTSTIVELAESFQLWRIGIIAPEEKRSLSRLATWTRQYHYQIYVDEEPKALAWLSNPGGDIWEVPTIARSWLPAAIHRAISVVDRDDVVPANAVARLLSAPAYAVWAFWFVEPENDQQRRMSRGNELVYVIHAPRDHEHVWTGTLMLSEQFVRGLEKARPIEGVPSSHADGPDESDERGEPDR